MNFDFSDDQRLLREQATRFLDEQASPAAVRAILEGDAPYDRTLWSNMAELGWMGTTIPEEYGGVGLSHVDLCVIAEELGRTLAPTPFASSVYLATEAILVAGNADQKTTYLPPLARGERIGTLALAEDNRAPTPTSITTRAAGGRLSGSKIPVPDGDVADFAVVVAQSGGTGERALSLYIVDLDGDGIAREAVETVDPTRSHARIAFDSAPAETLGEAGEGWRLLQDVLDRAAVMTAFEQVGGAQACLDMAKDYAINRYAFGRPIGSFQAIKHKLADVYMATEIARSNAYYGAWALSSGAAELPVAAAAARVGASDAFFLAAKENIQTHGGMGFTWEFDCHMYYRRAKLLTLNLGSQRRWKDLLVTRLEARNAA
jgi:alkylation response protein AidB-like acyl-CoA dehydrogenase